MELFKKKIMKVRLFGKGHITTYSIIDANGKEHGATRRSYLDTTYTPMDQKGEYSIYSPEQIWDIIHLSEFEIMKTAIQTGLMVSGDIFVKGVNCKTIKKEQIDLEKIIDLKYW